MRKVFSVSTSEFEPLSIDGNYLYGQYDRIHAFLKHKHNGEYQSILAKPLLTGNQIQWYAEFENNLIRISDLPESQQIKIKQQYWEIIGTIREDISNLELSKDTERQNWARLLGEVFKDENNIILSDGTNWCLLWGCKYRNRTENYLAPEFMPIKKHENFQNSPVTSNETSEVDHHDSQVTETVADNIDSWSGLEDEKVGFESNPDPPRRSRTGFGTRLKHFLRRSIYKIWGLLFFILFLLTITCLCKRCSIETVNRNCGNLNVLNKKAQQLEEKLKNKCYNGR